MTPTHVIILAQGKQQRLTGFKVAKQLLALPAHAACGAPNSQIMGRTIMQVVKLLTGVDLISDAHKGWLQHRITVVGWPTTETALEPVRVPYMEHPKTKATIDLVVYPEFVHLADPGNSSLQGIVRFLRHDEEQRVASLHQRGKHLRTVVLLGDVVYSWACLEAIFRGPQTSYVTFAGTPDLSAEGGELWGLSWFRDGEAVAMKAMYEALDKSSKADSSVYQCGQLRHWLWAMDPTQRSSWWVPINDYTMDVDLPEHLVTLARASLEAYADDRARKVVPRG